MGGSIADVKIMWTSKCYTMYTYNKMSVEPNRQTLQDNF